MQEIEFQQQTTTVWDFPERGAWATHKPDYRGNFAPQIPRNVILSYSNPGDLIVDPMVGSGTSLIEARLLDRNAIGYDINQRAVDITRERISFNVDNHSTQCVEIGDVRNLDKIKNDSVDLIVTHPPYWNLVTYSNGQNPDDLSSLKSLAEFLAELQIGILELFRVLKPNKYCAILIGDTRKGQHFVPLSHFVLHNVLKAGFVLKEDIIKTQHNTTHGPRWTASAKHYNFYLIMHEHLYVLRKPAAGEKLSRIRYSTFKGMMSLS